MFTIPFPAGVSHSMNTAIPTTRRRDKLCMAIAIYLSVCSSEIKWFTTEVEVTEVEVARSISKHEASAGP